MARKVICVGNLVHDEVFMVEELPRSGIKVGVVEYQQRFGGPAATAAVAICALGGEAAYWGRVGDDPAGAAGVAALERHGVDCSDIAVLPSGRTLRAIVVVDRKGERAIMSDRRSLSPSASVLPSHGLDGIGALLVDSRWPAAAAVMLDRAAAVGIPTVLDADGGAGADIEPLIAKADHVVFSSEGLLDHAGEGDPEEQLRRCRGSSDRIFAVTRGREGSLWLIGDDLVTVPSFSVPVADTTGCGDVFHGVYALGLCEGLAPLDAARFATAAAAVKAERGRGWDGMADRPSALGLLGRDDHAGTRNRKSRL